MNEFIDISWVNERIIVTLLIQSVIVSVMSVYVKVTLMDMLEEVQKIMRTITEIMVLDSEK